MNAVLRTPSAVAFCLTSALALLAVGCGESDRSNLSTEGSSCQETAYCTADCPPDDEECEQECIEDASELAMAKYQDVLSCNDNNCPDSGWGNSSSACFVKNCHAEAAACAPDYYGDATCNEVFACETGYGENCDERGSKEARLTHADLMTCWSEHDCQSIACAVEHCGDLATQCGIAGDSTCRETNVCLKSTQSWDCLESISPGDSAAQMSALQACKRSECPDAEGVNETVLCTSKNCRTERAECGLNGTQTTCADMWSCMIGENSTCSNADDFQTRLFEDYVYEGPAQEQAEFFELTQCVDDNCPDSSEQCIENECGEELNACTG